SLTVLSAIGHQGVFRLTGWSRQIHSGFHGPAATWEHKSPRHKVFRYGTLTLYGRPFQVVPLTRRPPRLNRQNPATQPHNTTPPNRMCSGTAHPPATADRSKSFP